jgi:hypothetical protein
MKTSQPTYHTINTPGSFSWVVLHMNCIQTTILTAIISLAENGLTGFNHSIQVQSLTVSEKISIIDADA